MRNSIVLLFLALLPSTLYGAELNAGFVQGLWYGNEPVIADTGTRIYVALRNTTGHDLTGTVRFTDNGEPVGVALVNALPGRIIEAWVDWTPRYGEHTIIASLTDVRINPIGTNAETADVENKITEGTIFVDYDTDGDATPNKTDEDDDNDGVRDIDEVTAGTNPLVAEPQKKEGSEIENSTKNEPNDTVEHTNDGSNENDTAHEGDVRGAQTSSQEGLEQYLGDGLGETAVASITEVIHETKTNLDAYRHERNDAIKDYFKDQTITVEEPTTTSDGTATITRRTIEKEESFWESALRGGKALLASLYTFVLWLTSYLLSYPAIVELLLLLFIIYFVYRVARRIGRRRIPN